MRQGAEYVDGFVHLGVADPKSKQSVLVTMRKLMKVSSLVLSKMRDEDENLRMRIQKMRAEHLRESSFLRHVQVACTHNKGAAHAAPYHCVCFAYNVSIVSHRL